VVVAPGVFHPDRYLTLDEHIAMVAKCRARRRDVPVYVGTIAR